MGKDSDRVEKERWKAHYRVHSALERDIDRRLEEMNLLRRQIEQERGIYLTRRDYESQHESLRTQLAELSRLVWIGFGVVMTVSALLAIVIRLLPK